MVTSWREPHAESRQETIFLSPQRARARYHLEFGDGRVKRAHNFADGEFSLWGIGDIEEMVLAEGIGTEEGERGLDYGPGRGFGSGDSRRAGFAFLRRLRNQRWRC